MFSPDGLSFLSTGSCVSDTSDVVIWNAVSGEQLRKCSFSGFKYHCIVWTSDSILVAGTGRHEEEVNLLDAIKGEQTMLKPSNNSTLDFRVCSLAFGAKARLLVCGHHGGNVTVFHLEKGKLGSSW